MVTVKLERPIELCLVKKYDGYSCLYTNYYEESLHVTIQELFIPTSNLLHDFFSFCGTLNVSLCLCGGKHFSCPSTFSYVFTVDMFLMLRI